MKRGTVILAVLVAMVIFGAGLAEAVEPVAHWKLDETSGLTAEDSAGDNDGTLVNGPVWTTGQIDGALEFDGVDDYVNLGIDPDLQPPLPVTISAWVKLEGLGQNQYIFDLDKELGWHSGIWFFVRDENNLTITYGDGGYSGPSSRRGKIGTSALDTGIWYHIAAVLVGPTDLTIYINGVDDGGVYTGSGGNLAYRNKESFIGTLSADRHFFDGIIDDVRLYDRALSAAEVEELYLGELVGLEITGPEEAAEDSQVQYSATAFYENSITKDVTDEAVWSVEPNVIADINAGLLTTEKIFQPEAVTITAEYAAGEITVEDEKEVGIFAICPEGSALVFDGVDDYVFVPENQSFNLASNVTYSFWVKAAEDWNIRTTDLGLIDKGSNSIDLYSKNYGPLVKVDCESSDKIQVWTRVNDISYETRSVKNDWNAGQWYHIAFVKDDTNVTFYIDGEFDSENFFPYEFNTEGTQDLVFGRQSTGTTIPLNFNGAIDDVRIYDRALSAEEVQVIMHARPAVDEPNLVGYWDFDEGEGQVAYDMSGNGNDGQLGSSPEADDSDPNWAESDAPVGICTLEQHVERNVKGALEIKLNILREIEEALLMEDASLDILGGLFGEVEYGYLDKTDIVRARQEIYSAIQSEEQASHSIEKSVGDLEDTLDIIGSEDGPPDSNSENENRLTERNTVQSGQ